MTGVAEKIADYITDVANRKDEPNASALKALASYVRDLAEDDERLIALDVRCCRDFSGGELDVFLPGQAASHAIWTYRGEGTPSAFLTHLISVATQDYMDRLDLAGEFRVTS